MSIKLMNYLLGVLLFISLLPACSIKDDDGGLVGNWVRRSDFEGVTRSNATAFTINNLAYVGLGFDGDDDLKDFWQYDATQDFWTKVDSFPGTARRAAVGFSVNGKGYVGTGYNGDLDEEFKDFWEFDPSAAKGQQWRRIADFIGSARYNAVAFSNNGRGYVGTGYDDNWLKDFYEYQPESDSWEQIVSVGGGKREDAVVFSIGEKIYLGTGRNNEIFVYDFWAFNPTEKNWSKMLDIDEEDDYEIARYGGIAFSQNGYGYIISGNNNNNLDSTWEYDPNTDTWEERTGLEGTSRLDAVGFTINNRSFITTGRNGSTRLDDLWEFFPSDELDEDD